MTTYSLDTAAAKQADQTKTRIDASGAYTGMFTKAKQVFSGQGTEGIDFSFEAEDGATADYLTLWTIKAGGEKIFGYGLLMAAMTCMKVRQIGTQKVSIEEWDSVSGARQPVMADCFTELMNKPIGVLLQREPMLDANKQVKYDKHGNPKWKLNITGFFEPATRMTAGEILDKAKEPSRLDKKLAYLKDKPIPAADDGGFSQPPPVPAAPAAGGFAGADEDDIPF